MAKYIKNKTFIARRKNDTGTFTTVNYKILRDKRLTSNAKILLIEILSNAENYNVIESELMDNMGVGDSAYRSAMDNLVECGYVRKTKIGNTNKNFYTISEYGNLNKKGANTEEPAEEPTSQPEAETVDVPSASSLKKEQIEKLQNLLMNFQEFLTVEVLNKFEDMSNSGFDFNQIKSYVQNSVTTEKKSFFKKVVNEIENCSSNRDTKVEAIKLVKSEVFDNNKKLDCERARKRANQNINRRKPLDPESLAADRADGI